MVLIKGLVGVATISATSYQVISIEACDVRVDAARLADKLRRWKRFADLLGHAPRACGAWYRVKAA